ncbi:hypothetical protein N658DRAFT_569187 [Parathielavia hyrcaniae]|uniref:Nucleoside-diphosphate-sugar epimerase n=1 Tax=Parathielavia hyrcaniae TaxID=113614 RepID=A0AAN6PX41_9PEZI|nr:hypothetical protein N658DRAFT_569187 [Parathielavia hyrcaniae]
MHLILTGGTGLVGTAVLDAMIQSKGITKISVLTRRPIKFTDDRIEVIMHKDFTTYDSDLLAKLQGAQGCVWALGISQNQVNKADYITITKTFPLAAAKAFQTLVPSKTSETTPSQPFHFVLVSGDGTTFSPGVFTPFFGRIKGETELALAEMQKANPSALRATTVRPAFVDFTGHDEIKPHLPEVGRLMSAVVTVMNTVTRRLGLLRSKWAPTEPLGRFMAGMAMGMWDGALDGGGVDRLPGGFTVVHNHGMRRIMGLDAAGGSEREESCMCRKG